MEMTFPHFALRQDSDNRSDHKVMLAALIARQANGQTVRAMRLAERDAHGKGSDGERRINYFARHAGPKTPVRGAFWQNIDTKPNCESGVYQAGSTNIKVPGLEDDKTGEQLGHAGHGALRKL